MISELIPVAALVVGPVAGLVVGGLAGHATEAAYRARLVHRAVAAELEAHGITSSPRAVVRHQAAGGFEVDSIKPARVSIAPALHD